MLLLDELSKIGFGCYRVSSASKEHYEALLYALRLGCNLMDTSANYMDGGSELLIGRVLSDNPKREAFVVTKAGYIQGSTLVLLKKLHENGLGQHDLIYLSDDFKYSIHPDYLGAQIELSCSRLQRRQIDGFLLHNPEYYFEQEADEISQEQYYLRIGRAFEFLEAKVSEGKIRYYGISSNTFPYSIYGKSTTNLLKVLAIAEDVSSDNHFKLIQFPFNLVENEALKPMHDNTSLIELAKANNIVTFSNRPLNAITPSGPLRIATYEDSIQQLDEEVDSEIFHAVLGSIGTQLQALGRAEDPLDFTVMNYLHDNWMRLNSTEAVTTVFREHFFPFVLRLYQSEIPDEVTTLHMEFYKRAVAYSKKAMTHKAMAFRQEMIMKGIMDDHDHRSLPVVVCERYINSGIDHVLVGMKNVGYVDDLKDLF